MSIKIILINETDNAGARLPGLLASRHAFKVSLGVLIVPGSPIQ